MESSDRPKDDGESAGSQSEGLDSYRGELAEKYRDPVDSKRETERGSGERSEELKGKLETRSDDAPAETAKEQPLLSTDSPEKAEVDIDRRAESPDNESEDWNANGSRPEAEKESRTELEEFRDYVKAKYPAAHGSEEGGQEPDRGSNREEGSGNDSDLKSSKDQGNRTPNDTTEDAATAQAAPERHGHDETNEKEGRPIADGHESTSIAPISQPEFIEGPGRKTEDRDEGKEESDNHESKESQATKDIVPIVIHDTDTVSNLQTAVDPINIVETENPARTSREDGPSNSGFEGIVDSAVPSSAMKENKATMQVDQRDEGGQKAEKAQDASSEERPSTVRPQTEEELRVKTSDWIKIEFREAPERQTVHDEHRSSGRSVIDDSVLERGAVAGRGSDKETKTGTETHPLESHSTSPEHNLSTVEAIGNPHQPARLSTRERINPESFGTRAKEDENPERNEPRISRGPRNPRAEYSPQEKTENDTIPVNANHRQSDPLVIRFDIPKQAIEVKTGTKIEEGRLYDIKGTIVGKYDFEMQRTIKNYVHHFVPVEEHDKIQTGKVYDIRITSIKEVPLTPAQTKLMSEWRERSIPWNRIMYRLNHMPTDQTDQNKPLASQQHEIDEKQTKLHQLEKLERVDSIGATFVAISRFQKGDLASPRDRFYFRIDNSEYKQKTGLAIDEGSSYRISGEIEGVGPFQKKLRSVAAGQDMPIYVPHELKSKMELGKEYKITISSVERIPSIRDSWEKLEKSSNEWSWREIASWIDTEGRINSRTGFYADIAQKDKKVIQEICSFYDEHGLHPIMTLQKSVGCYHAHLQRVDEVAVVIKNVESYMRTENKKEQIEQFKYALNAPRKRLQKGIREARKILDL